MILEAVQVAKLIKLVDARTQLFLTQKQLADLTTDEEGNRRVTPNVISNCENGLPIRRMSAWAILDGLNKVRTQKNMPLLDFDQMDWKLQGDGGTEEK